MRTLLFHSIILTSIFYVFIRIPEALVCGYEFFLGSEVD